jgi:hypothetical protein
MKNRIVFVAFVCIDLRVGAAAPDSPKEVLNFKIGDDWKVIANSETGHGHSVTYARDADAGNPWKERVAYLYGARKRGLQAPEKEFRVLEADTEKRWPGLTEWKAISQDENSILYEWHIQWSASTHEEWNISRIIHTKHSWFTWMYTARAPELAPETRTQWIKTFSDATVVAADSAAITAR